MCGCLVNDLESQPPIKSLRPVDFEHTEFYRAPIPVSIVADPPDQLSTNAAVLNTWRDPDATEDDRIIFPLDEETSDCLAVQKNNLMLRYSRLSKALLLHDGIP
jgi:hypothetical protein